MTFSYSFYLLAFLAASTFVSAQLPASCSRQCVRREVRDLSQDDRNKYFTAVKQLMKDGKWDTYTTQHLAAANTAHGTSLFLVWHRAFIHQVEKDLQSVDNSVCLHYWSWDLDSQAPEASPIFTDGFYGGTSGCLSSSLVESWRPQHPSPHCLSRSLEPGTFYSPELLNRIIASSNDYAGLNRRIESPPHDIVHSSINGDMGTMASPNDPIFFAHHAFVDLLYYRWQVAHPKAARGFPGSTSQRLAPLPYSVEDAFDISKMCYSYAEVGANRASSLNAEKAKPDPKQMPSAHPPSKLNTTLSNVLVKPADPTVYSSADRRNIVSLKKPNPVPEAWLAMKNISVQEVRDMEAEYSKVYDQLNDIYGYVSPCALLRREDMLSTVIKKLNGSVVVPLSSLGLVEISYENSTLASQIVKTVREVLPDVYIAPNNLKDKLQPIVGKSTVLSADSPSNILQTVDSSPADANYANYALLMIVILAGVL